MAIQALGETTQSVHTTRVPSSASTFEWRDLLSRQQSKLRAAVLATSDQSGVASCAKYSELYEKLLVSRFEACRAALGLDTRVTLGAVGSFGRRLLSPNSDLDVRILCADELYEASESLVSSLLYPLWDAGLDVGHQVITIDQVIELGRTDLTTATALLDWRTIAGDAKLGTELVDRAMATLFSGQPLRDFVERLEAYNRSRHSRYGDSVYLLEPNVKSGAGGLRDLDVAHWYARAEHHVSDLSELVERGVLLSREWAQIETAREHLLRLRNTLHALMGRKTDRLTFDHQELLAEKLGYGRDAQSVERMMSEYYRHARTIRGACEMLAPRAGFVPAREAEPLEAGIGVVDGELVFEQPETLSDRPALALRIYAQAVQRDRRVSAAARRAIARMTSSEAFCDALRKDPDAPGLFRSLVCSIRDTRLDNDSILSEMHDAGLLLAMFPEFAPVVGRVHHDTYHVYTVDVHSIAAVDYLRKLARGSLLTEHPLACRLAAEQVRREVLFFATLLHDVGKVLGGVGHAERGAQMAADMLARLNFEDADIADVQLLIRLHLHLYQAATRRDVEDPETIRGVCESLGSQEALRELYLLTVADVTTTSPRSMTVWKRDVLDELYIHADRYLSAQPGPTALAQASTIKDRILSLATGMPYLCGFLSKFLNGLPERYLFANDLRAVIAHARFALDARGERSCVRIGAQREQHTELWVVADDQPGLLALIAATFWRAKLNVLSAQVYTWRDDDGRTRSLDTFWVRHRSGEALADEDISGLRALLRDTLDSGFDQNAVTLPPPSLRMGGAPPIVTDVTIDNRSATNHSVIEVITQDRPNLLYWLSCRIQELGLDIWFAKISTEGDRAVDVFYVSEHGGKVTHPERLQHIKTHLITAINQTTPERKSSRPPPPFA